MEMFMIFLCIVIGHAFGDLQGIENGEDDLRAQEDAKRSLSPNVRDADHLDQSPQSKDVQMTVQSGIPLHSLLGYSGHGKGAESTKLTAASKGEKPNLQEADRVMDNKRKTETQEVDNHKNIDNAKPEEGEKRRKRETFECEEDEIFVDREKEKEQRKDEADLSKSVLEPTEEGLLGIVEGSSAPPGEEGDEQRKEESNVPPFCNGTPKVQLTEAEMKEFVESHNEARRREHTADAIKMVWNPTLALIAQQKANTCIWNHSMTTSCTNRKFAQNMQSHWDDEQKFIKLNVTFITFSYVRERNDWNWETRTCADGRMCGHWRAIVSAASRTVGCGLARCRKFWYSGISEKGFNRQDVGYKKNALLSVCNYSLRKFGFTRGKYCTQCNNTIDEGDKGWRCEDKLCVPCDPEVEKGCNKIYKTPLRDSEGYMIQRPGPARKIEGDVDAEI